MRAAALVPIAVRNVLRNRRRSLLAALSVFLGVFAMVFMRGFLDGIQGALIDDAVNGQVGAIKIHRSGYLKQVFGLPLQLDVDAEDAFLARLEQVPGVTAATPRLVFGGMLAAGDETRTSLLTAIDPVRELRVCPARAARLTSGSFLSLQPAGGLVLSAEMARRLSLRPSGTLAVLSPDRDGSLNAMEATLVGTTGLPGAPGIDTKQGVVALAAVQELLRMPGRATEIAVAVEELADVDRVRERIARELGPAFEVITWREALPAMVEMFLHQDVVFGFVSLVFLVIALIGISNTMLMSVLERTREIGVLMAVGLRRRTIVQLFLLEAVALAVAGAVPGAIAAVAVARALQARGIPFHAMGGGQILIRPEVRAAELAFAIGVCVAGTVLAALYPAWRASRLRPVEALSTP